MSKRSLANFLSRAIGDGIQLAAAKEKARVEIEKLKAEEQACIAGAAAAFQAFQERVQTLRSLHQRVDFETAWSAEQPEQEPLSFKTLKSHGCEVQVQVKNRAAEIGVELRSYYDVLPGMRPAREPRLLACRVGEGYSVSVYETYSEPVPDAERSALARDFACSVVLRAAREALAITPLDIVVTSASIPDAASAPPDPWAGFHWPEANGPVWVVSTIVTRDDLQKFEKGSAEPFHLVRRMKHRIRAWKNEGLRAIEPFTLADVVAEGA